MEIGNRKRNVALNMKRCAEFIFFTLFLFFIKAGFALDVPSLSGRVVDHAQLLNESETAELTEYLETLEENTGIQIALLTIPSLEGDSLEAFSMRVAEAWKLGEAKQDNGAFLLVSFAEKKIRIEVGYGLESELTDMKSGLIIRKIIAPSFQRGKFGEGIVEGIKNMGAVASGNAESVSRKLSDNDGTPLPVILFILLFYFLFFTIVPNLAMHRSFWIPWFLFSKYRGSGKSRSHGGSSFRDFDSDFTFRGGGFGGGFSGGGGSFGGGGASGGW